MRTMKLGSSSLEVPVVAVGCMRLSKFDKAEADIFIRSAIEMGANFFDHADIYGRGTSEQLFGEALLMTPSIRENMFLQSKCGIVPRSRYDFSKEYILDAVDGILKRLCTDYLDVLLLHRPDALVEPDEVAAAFDALEKSGKVRHFGVSNHNPMQIQLLNKSLRHPIIVNQIQLSLAHAYSIAAGINVNINSDAACNRDGGVLDYCRLHDITVQTWSPLQFGMFQGIFIDHEQYPALNSALAEIADIYNVSKATIAIAWLLRHPARLQPVTGTTNIEHLRDCCAAANINLTRSEWYQLFIAAGNQLP